MRKSKMKPVYFETLDFESKIPDNYYYHDLGYVKDILEKTKEIYRNAGLPYEDKYLKSVGADMSGTSSGSSILFYLKK